MIALKAFDGVTIYSVHKIYTYGRITNHNVISAVVCVVKQVIVHRTWIRLVFVIRGEEDGVCKNVLPYSS